MSKKLSHPLWKRQVLTFASVAVLGAAAAVPLAHASPYVGASASPSPHVSVVHLWINGHSVPAETQSRIIHFPGGVMQVQTVTWGSSGSGGHSQVSRDSLSPAQAQAMVRRSLWQMQAMQVAMDRQIARMQRLMRVSFGPFAMPSFNSPVPVTRLLLVPEMPFSGTTPSQSMTMAKGSDTAPSISMTPIPGHRILHVHWDRQQVVSPSPKIPL
ncbi:hypothetical protein GL267_010695 [Acidithiobacillus ferrianus]|uniref:Uncharacterized protein n=2 Tax=Acidithiobacillus ferrianus TaxID=2678518 RepID=A0ACD5H868_9PROT|nr:hypothetical protein [Acidithiobacillus ferrianus]